MQSSIKITSASVLFRLLLVLIFFFLHDCVLLSDAGRHRCVGLPIWNYISFGYMHSEAVSRYYKMYGMRR